MTNRYLIYHSPNGLVAYIGHRVKLASVCADIAADVNEVLKADPTRDPIDAILGYSERLMDALREGLTEHV